MQKFLVNSGFERATSSLRVEVTPNNCVLQNTNNSADLNSALHEQFLDGEKKQEGQSHCGLFGQGGTEKID